MKLPRLFVWSHLGIVLLLLTATFPFSANLHASDVIVSIETSTDGSSWSPTVPGLWPVTELTTYYRVAVVPSGGGDPSYSSPIVVDMPAIGGHVEVQLESSTDLQGWTGTDPGEITISPKEFYRVVANGFAEIAAGSFEMGDSLGDGGIDEQQHTVTIDKYYIQLTEVTKAEWDDLVVWASLPENGYDLNLSSADGKGDTHPVHSVTWYEAVKFANACSERAELTPVYTKTSDSAPFREGTHDLDIDYTANGYRLPTEAEWEKAARGGLSEQRFPLGVTISHIFANFQSSAVDVYDLSTINSYHPAWDDLPEPYTSPVGTFASNGFGLYDVAGNLREWCADWFSGTYYGISPAANPKGPDLGFDKVVRGGSWSNPASDCRVARRLFEFPSLIDAPNRHGFRLARSSLE